jgi:hypothetical protein
MATPNPLTRLEFLEQRVTVLETLPAKIDALADQIVQLRGEMRSEFSALRAEMRGGDDVVREGVRDEIRAGDEETRRVLREEIRAGDEETRRQMREINDETRREMRQLNDETRQLMVDLNAETRTHMLVLHEDLVERIKRIGEGPAPRPSGRSKK